MPDILDRATRLVAVLSAAGGQARTLAEVSADSAIPPATCSRLLKRLAKLGWVDQDGNRGAYRLGPWAFALTAGEPYAAPLLAAVQPVLRELADRTGCGCSLSVLRPWRRQLLWICGGEHGSGRQLLREENDIWMRASGRLLLACLRAPQRSRWIDHLGLPSPRQWPGIVSRAELEAELVTIRRNGWAQAVDAQMGLVGAAVLVGDGSGGHAALGLFIARDRYEPEMLEQLQNAAGAIRKEMRR